jgi:hypothetical protein
MESDKYKIYDISFNSINSLCRRSPATVCDARAARHAGTRPPLGPPGSGSYFGLQSSLQKMSKNVKTKIFQAENQVSMSFIGRFSGLLYCSIVYCCHCG